VGREGVAREWPLGGGGARGPLRSPSHPPREPHSPPPPPNRRTFAPPQPQGRVVGVAIALRDAGAHSTSRGVGHAVPIDAVRRVVEQLLAHGRVKRPSMGVVLAPQQVGRRAAACEGRGRIGAAPRRWARGCPKPTPTSAPTPARIPLVPPLPPQVLRTLGIEGVLILEVPAGSPAAAAGLRATYRDVFGDVVLGDIIGGVGGGGWGGLCKWGTGAVGPAPVGSCRSWMPSFLTATPRGSPASNSCPPPPPDPSPPP
jgi:hypothetical protein